MTNPSGNKRHYPDRFCVRCGALIARSEGRNYRAAKFCGAGCMHAAKKHTPAQALAAFWAKVNKTAGCWLWTASVNNWGYGRVKVPFTSERGAHRISWILHKGQIPAGKLLLHSCDVPRCVNPAHLRIGTLEENKADSVSKQRHVYGVRSSHAKLTEEQVRFIKAHYRKTAARRGNGSEIARELGVTPGVVHAIGTGRTWKYVK